MAKAPHEMRMAQRADSLSAEVRSQLAYVLLPLIFTTKTLPSVKSCRKIAGSGQRPASR